MGRRVFIPAAAKRWRPDGSGRWRPGPERRRKSPIRPAAAAAARDRGGDVRQARCTDRRFLFRLFQLFDNALKRARRDVFLALEFR
jgi:hypothetical protein